MTCSTGGTIAEIEQSALLLTHYGPKLLGQKELAVLGLDVISPNICLGWVGESMCSPVLRKPDNLWSCSLIELERLAP